MNLRYSSSIILVILCLWGLHIATAYDCSATTSDLLTLDSSFYSPHDPINIVSNQDFVDCGFSGNGSQVNPYVIERLNITSSTPMSSAILVQDTSSYFVIRECYIVSEYIGILVVDCASGTGLISNNTCISSSGDGGGISIVTDNCTISNNRCINWAQGIHLNEVSHCSILRNNVSDGTYQGINVRYSNNNTVVGNRISGCVQHGLVLVGTSAFNTIYDNTFIENGNIAMYTVDNSRTGVLSSQGYDEGINNTWYNSNTERGNSWSDYFGSGAYAIDGPSNSSDLYPINSQSPQDNFVTLLTIITIGSASVVVVILLVIGYRRFTNVS
jgi:parallel beta-helix repeat protein